MTAPGMSIITASLENFSLNHQHHISGASSSRFDDEVATTYHPPIQTSEISSDDTSLEPNSHVSLPWDQCFHLKTREIYYTNRRNDMVTNEDPTNIQENGNGSLYSEAEEEEESSYDSDESSIDDSDDSSTDDSSTDDSDDSSFDSSPLFLSNLDQTGSDVEEVVLVVAGCKGCYLYIMVPKGLHACPRCNSPLIHFDGSSSGFH